MNRGLGDKAVRRRDAEEACDEGGDAEQEEVPVEAGGLAEGEVCALGHEGGDVVVEEEEDPEDDAEREGDANPLSVQLPELHEP